MQHDHSMTGVGRVTMVRSPLRIRTTHMAMVQEPGGSDTMVRELPRSMAQLRRRPAMAKVWCSITLLLEFSSLVLLILLLALALPW